MLTIFLIGVLGYLLGSIKVYGLRLGTSGVLIVALFFGHFGYEVSVDIRNLGLVCFLTAVGLMAGPVFFKLFAKKGLAYVVIGCTIVASGVVLTAGLIHLSDMPMPLALGMMTGALTSTPGLAAAFEATMDALSTVGYGIAYPFGVVGVVLFVQLVPKCTRRSFVVPSNAGNKNQTLEQPAARPMDPLGFFAFLVAAMIGMWLSRLELSLGQGAVFSPGISGGPLLAGLLVGYITNKGRKRFAAQPQSLAVMREFGLILFLIGAGLAAGNGFFDVVRQHGFLLFGFGVGLTVLPMTIGLLTALHLFKMDLTDALGSVCGGMTSTPALGTLINLTQSDDVAASYAATYPAALILMVVSLQFMAIWL